MPEHGVLPDVIERFLDEPVVPPPLESVRTEGAAVRRRRRRGVIASCAAVLVIAGSAFAGQTLFGDERREPTADPQVEQPAVPEAPPGTRWAGTGRVVLAVPEDWSDGATKCNQPTENTVYFPAEVSRACGVHGPISSLAISDHPFGRPNIIESVPDGEVAGHEVQIAGHLCAEPKVMTCALDVAVPDLDAYFRITLHGTDVNEGLEAIRNTLTVLPPTATAVPEVPLRIDEARAVLEAAGLEPLIEIVTCADSDGCEASTRVEPAAGRVLPVGAPVTVRVSTVDRAGPTYAAALDCPSDYQRGFGTFDVVAPSSPKEAREQGWPTSPLEAVMGVPTAEAWRHLGIVDLTVLDPVDDGMTRVSGQDAEGRTVLIMRVEELVAGAWAMTGTEACG